MLSLCAAFAQLSNNGGWQFQKTQDNMNIYLRKGSTSQFSEVRVTTRLNVPLKNIIKAMGDVAAYKDWVYKTVSARTLKTVSENDFFYYIETDLPYPMSNRDMVVHCTRWTDAAGVFHSKSVAAKGMVPAKDDLVRIQDYESLWSVKAVGPNTVEIDYRVRSNPGGELPAWAVEMFSFTGPVESIKLLGQIALKAKYR